MNTLPRDTVTPTECLFDTTDFCNPSVIIPRVESNPVARKRRMTEQLSSNTSKSPRRGLEPEEMNLEEPRNDDIENEDNDRVLRKPPMHPDLPRKRIMELSKRDDSSRLRKTIQWLEEGARKLREDLADVRSELHEERRASRMIKKDIIVAVREARALEAAKHQSIISELKIKLAEVMENSHCSSPTRIGEVKAELLKEENHRREISAARKRLVEADETIRKLKSHSIDFGGNSLKRRRLDGPDFKRMENEIQNLRQANKRLEDKLQIVIDAERARAAELRAEHEKHEAEMSALRKAFRSETIKMMDEIKGKEKEIEKMERKMKKMKSNNISKGESMRKLRDSERGHQVRLEPCIEDKLCSGDNSGDHYKGDCENLGEVDRLRELAVEQQEIIEFLRQALKERERKLEQLSNKKRKEEFYKQWLELEPVAEVDDEEEHEEGDSALSSAPSSLSPQPGVQWQPNSVTRESYDSLLLELEELQMKYFEEQQELSHAKSQVRDLEKALLQETRGSQNSRRALSDKLKEADERESGLLAEISELREQNELLEFRVLELEEIGGPRETPDTADSGIVSPEPIHMLHNHQNSKQQRAIATVIPYNTYNHNQTTNLSPITVQKSPLSLQESGIFEEEEDENQIELTSCGTQTETPSCELLQEVERLQQLRERFQERAVKVPVPVDILDALEDNRLASYKEKIRELEERLEVYEVAEVKRSRDQRVAKQREEDLLDENYRLTERVYWLENEIQNYEAGKKVDKETITDQLCNFQDFGTCTDNEKIEIENISQISKCQNYLTGALDDSGISETCLMSKSDINDLQIESSNNTETSINCSDCQNLRKDYDEKVQQLAKSEYSFRRQIMDLERKEVTFAETLKQVDTTWNQLESNYNLELEKMRVKVAHKEFENFNMTKKIIELEEKISHQPMDVDVNFEKNRINKITKTNSASDSLRDEVEGVVGKLGREVTREGFKDDVDGVKFPEVRVENQESPADALITISESEAPEKVRKRWKCRSEREGWAMKVSKTSKSSRSVENVRSIIDHHRLILYPEICV